MNFDTEIDEILEAAIDCFFILQNFIVTRVEAAGNS